MKSIVVPAYNEEKRIEEVVKALLELSDIEVIISDDGSTDRTKEIAAKLAGSHKGVYLTSDIHRGKGAAIKHGFAIAHGEILGFIDADMSAHPRELLKLFTELEKGADLAIGSRDLPDSKIPIKQPNYRRLLGDTYRGIAKRLLNVNVMDFQCGCKALKRKVWENIEVKNDGFAFDTELIARANANGFKIKEVPITWQDSKESKVNPLKDPLKMFAALLRIWRGV